MSKACLVDTTLCIGCRACQVACKQANENEAEKTTFFAKEGGFQNPADLSPNTYSLVTFNELVDELGELKWIFARRQCMHCVEPSCESACIVGALTRTPEGAVVYDKDKCIGCRYCMVACPFGIPTFEWDKQIPYITKCEFCTDRQADTTAPDTLNDVALSDESKSRHVIAQTKSACSSVCPTGAIKFGDRDQLLLEGNARISASPKKYVDHIFGEEEVGGTGWLYLAAVPFKDLGFPQNLGKRSYPSYTQAAKDAVAPIVLGVGAALSGIYWFTRRKNDVAKDNQETNS
jgi:formate dehydrogenase iron-sulfur subunit